MSTLKNTDWAGEDISRPIIEKSAVRCTISAATEGDWEADPFDGTERQQLQVSLKLAEKARTVSGSEVNPGYTVTDFLDSKRGLNGSEMDEEKKQRNKRDNSRRKELAVAALGLGRDTRENVAELLEAMGGWAGIAGKEVIVRFSHYEKKDGSGTKQAINGYAAVPKA